MNARIFIVLVLSPIMSSPASSADWSLEIVGPTTATMVKLEHETKTITVKFDADAATNQFKAAIDGAKILAPNDDKLDNPFQLIIGWPTKPEALYVTLSRLTPSPALELRLEGPSPATTFKHNDLTAIEMLGRDGGDIDTLVAKYVRARRFHLHWRGLNLEDHQIAIRSARAWLDAAMLLVNRRGQVFRWDQEISKIVDDYIKLAQAAPNTPIAKRIFKVFPQATVTQYRQQALSAPFAVVGEIPGLLQRGQKIEALQINTIALQQLRSEAQDTRVAVADVQGVNLALLERNQAYLRSLTADSP